MTGPSTPLIDAEHTAFMQCGVSISVGGCDAGNLPSLTRALGCQVSSDRLRITVFVSAGHAGVLLDDLRANGAIAAVFSQPSTHRTVQLKGKDAQVRPLRPGELQLVDAYRASFVAELESLYYDPHLVRTFLSCPPEDLVALEFTPCAAFSQTPGPHAGEPLKGAA